MGWSTIPEGSPCLEADQVCAAHHERCLVDTTCLRRNYSTDTPPPLLALRMLVCFARVLLVGWWLRSAGRESHWIVSKAVGGRGPSRDADVSAQSHAFVAGPRGVVCELMPAYTARCVVCVRRAGGEGGTASVSPTTTTTTRVL